MEIFHSDDAAKLLRNKFVVIIGDSIQRGVYKDLIHLLQADYYTPETTLKRKGEHSCQGDELIEGGQLEDMSNKTTYREVRQYQTPYHLVRFYFVTRCYSDYVETILLDLSQEPEPSVVIMNSCLWDITRYGPRSKDEYKKNLQRLCRRFTKVLPPTCLIIWHTTMPIAQKIRGGFLVKQIQFMEDVIRLDAMEANFYAAQVMNDYSFDVLDLHYHFRGFLQHRKEDGVHWDNKVHRRITNLVLTHISQAWDVPLTRNAPFVSADFIDFDVNNNNNSMLCDKRQVEWNAESEWSRDIDMRPPPQRQPRNHFRSESLPMSHMWQREHRVPVSHQLWRSHEHQGPALHAYEQQTYEQQNLCVHTYDKPSYEIRPLLPQPYSSVNGTELGWYEHDHRNTSYSRRRYLNPRYMPY